MSKISIIVPVYKVEKYLNRCLDSILAQTFTDWECILIDDGSPDNSGKICDEYAKKDERFVVIHQENAGVSAARNAGLDIAKGEYITFVDSDDWVESNFLQEQYSDIVSDDYDVCICGFVGKQKSKKKILNCKEAKKKLFGQKGTGAYSFLRIIKKEILVGMRYDTSVSYLEDTDFFYRLYEKCNKILWTNKSLYNYYINPLSVTRQKGFTRQKMSMFYTIDRLYEDEIDEELKEILFSSSIRVKTSECIRFLVSTNDFNDKEFSKIKSQLVEKINHIILSKKLEIRYKVCLWIILSIKDYEKSLIIKFLRKVKR